MQRLPIKYFDQNDHGDIMSHYTNDIDTLRQMISQSFPQLLASSVMVLTVFCIMIYYCLWLTLVILVGVVAMLIVTKKVGGQSAQVRLPPAGRPRQGGGLCGGNDERPEGC